MSLVDEHVTQSTLFHVHEPSLLVVPAHLLTPEQLTDFEGTLAKAVPVVDVQVLSKVAAKV